MVFEVGMRNKVQLTRTFFRQFCPLLHDSSNQRSLIKPSIDSWFFGDSSPVRVSPVKGFLLQTPHEMLNQWWRGLFCGRCTQCYLEYEWVQQFYWCRRKYITPFTRMSGWHVWQRDFVEIFFLVKESTRNSERQSQWITTQHEDPLSTRRPLHDILSRMTFSMKPPRHDTITSVFPNVEWKGLLLMHIWVIQCHSWRSLWFWS